VVVSNFAEDLDKSLYAGDGGPARYAKENAVLKASAVYQRLSSETGGDKSDQPLVVVGSDTIVDLDGLILEKPATPEEACATLRRLSGRAHLVHSGVSIFTSASGPEEPRVSFTTTTHVCFGDLTDADIEAYVASGEPMDKAGSYGIQGLGGQFVDRIEGCYFNVMGFPMRRFSTEFSALLQEGC
jgi:septum formation protein